MKIFADFYQLSTGYIPGTCPPQFSDDNKFPISVCGDRGIIQIDGRLKSEKIHTIATDECKKRGFVGYRILKGPSLLTAREISKYIRV